MPVYKFNDKQGNRDRSCRYGIVFDGKCFSQSEAESQKLAVFQSLGYQKNGKWSNTDWQVTTKSAVLVVCMSPFEGWPDTLEQCLDHVQDRSEGYTGYRPSTDEALAFMKSMYAKTFERVNSKESLVNELV